MENNHIIQLRESIKQIIHDLLKTNLVLIVVLILQYPFTSKFKHFFLLCQISSKYFPFKYLYC
jgi:hypothetical protein